jgi:3-dehydroquinate dehydratase type I
MICASIAEPTAGECIKALRDVRFAEIRIDKLRRPLVEDIRAIFSSHPRLIATCRAGKVPYDSRRLLLETAIDGGAAFVDVEVEMNRAYKSAIVNHAMEKGCTPIVSFHNYNETPPGRELVRLVERCFGSGAEIAKIACMVNSEEDNDALLGLLEMKKRLVVIGMGEMGRRTRVMAPLLGAEFTFASLGRKTAEGQLSVDEMKDLIRELRGAGPP